MKQNRIRVAGTLVLALVSAAALPSAATASWHNRNCSQAGLVFGPADANGTDPYEVKSPFHMSITPAAVLAVARSWVPYGLQPPRHAIPCIAATSIVATASQSWLHWRHRGHGQITVKSGSAINYTTYPVGRFRCTSKSLKAPRVASVSCVGKRGAIRARFSVEQNPN